MEHSLLIHKMVKLVDAKYVTNGEFRTLDLRLEINIVTSKLKSQNLSTETNDPIPDIWFTQATDPNKRVNRGFGNTVNIVINPTIVFQIV